MPSSSPSARAAKRAGNRRKQGNATWMSNIYVKGTVGLLVVVLFSIAFTYVEERWPTVSQSFKTSKGKGKGKGKSKLSLNVEKTVERAAMAAKNMEFERAAKLANRVLERDPDNWQSWLILGGALRADAPGGAAGILPAVAAYEKCVSLPGCKDLADAWHSYAMALSATPKTATTKHAVFKSLALKPDNVEALLLATQLTNFSDPKDKNAASSVFDKIKKLLRPYDADVIAAKEAAAAAAATTAAAAAATGDENSTEAGDSSKSASRTEETPTETAEKALGRKQRAKLHYALFTALDQKGHPSMAAAHLNKANFLKSEVAKEQEELMAMLNQKRSKTSIQQKVKIAESLYAFYRKFDESMPIAAPEEPAADDASSTGNETELVGSPDVAAETAETAEVAKTADATDATDTTDAVDATEDTEELTEKEKEYAKKLEEALAKVTGLNEKGELVAQYSISDLSDDHGEGYCRRLLEPMGVAQAKEEEKDEAGKGEDEEGAAAEDEEEEDEDEDEEKKKKKKKKKTGPAEPFVRPLMIVGLPRSGSSLLQQMLAAHPNILVGDDYAHMTKIIGNAVSSLALTGLGYQSVTSQIKAFLKRPDTEGHEGNTILKSFHEQYLSLLHADNKDAAKAAAAKARPPDASTAAGTAALAALERLELDDGASPSSPEGGSGGFFAKFLSLGGGSGSGGGAKGPAAAPLLYTIDKNPANTWWAGGMAPPCAKIILLDRNPMDVAFGNFKHDADVMKHDWALNQTEMVHHIALTELVMKIWKEHLPPDSVISVRYEDLVGKPADVMQRLTAFLGLTVDRGIQADLIAPEKSTEVSTSSSFRRVPLALGSNSGQWTRYATLMEDAMVGLKVAQEFVNRRFLAHDLKQKWLSGMERESLKANSKLGDILTMATKISEGAAANVEPLEKPTESKVIRPMGEGEQVGTVLPEG